jgi:hypothetical protein
METIDDILKTTPVTQIDDVLDRMTRINQALPQADGVRAFNGLYTMVTAAIIDAEENGSFTNSTFLKALDVQFANLFFAAASAWRSGGAVPRAWAPLFNATSRTDIHPLQFALAGMNAHINRDLPVALVKTFTASGVALRRDGPEHEDYERVNDILAGVEVAAKANFFDPLAKQLDKAFDGVDDIVANWGVREAREAAWVNAEAMWAIRSNLTLSTDYLSVLDGTVGFAGRGLLVPTAV